MQVEVLGATAIRSAFDAAAAFGERVRRIYVERGYSVVEVPRDTIVARPQFIRGRLGLAGN